MRVTILRRQAVIRQALRMARRTICLILIGTAFLTGRAQAPEDRILALTRQLDSLARFIPGLNHRSDLALSDVPLHDYVRSLGKVHQINLYIDEYPKAIITNDFVNESVKSIFVFVCKKFDLSIEPVGTILNFLPYQKLPPKPAPAKPKPLNVVFAEGKLSFDLDQDSLAAVLRQVSRLTGHTLVAMPGAGGPVSGYVPPSEFETAMENMLLMNGLALQRHRKGYYAIQPIGSGTPARQAGGKTNPTAATSAQGLSEYSLQVAADTSGANVLFLSSEGQELDVVVKDIFHALQQDYYLLEPLQGTTTARVDGASIDQVLSHILRGTPYGFKLQDGVYVIGGREMEGLRTVKIVNLKYRPTKQIIELIPTELKKGVELKEFVELNRIILSGQSENIRAIEQLILELDRPVPMVKIEMVVVDVDFNRILEAGIKAGLAQPGDTVGAVKSLFPGLDYTLTGTALNTILASSGVPGLANLGALRSNFYVQLQAQESRGLLRVVTRPVISTLNGNQANLTIGQTQYYRLQTDINANGAVNAYTQVAQRFETIEINTTITVKPLVSQDGSVTLELNPTFTSPGAQADPNIPPTILTRSFQSTIRVRDGETVVLGGLTREATSNSTEGLPVLSRVPVLRWFFGKNSRNRSRSSLLIYITPTIEYN